jgi:O-antigen ligase
MTASRPFILFLSGIFLSSVIFSPFVLDFTLTPRLITISLTLLAVLILSSKQIIKISTNFIFVSALAYVLFSWASTSWAHTRSEAVFENIKLGTCFLVFILSAHFFGSDKERTLVALCKMSVALFLIEFAVALYQLLHLPSLEKGSVYTIYGLNSHKNLFSSFILLQLPFMILCAKKFDRKWVVLSVRNLIILYIILLLVLQTKSVWIACIVSALAFVGITFYKKMRFSFPLKYTILTVVILANIFFIFLLPNIIHKGIDFNLAQAKQNSVEQKKELDQERLVLWDKTYTMFDQHKVTGVGAGNWQIYFPNATLTGLWRAEDLNYTFQRPHNDLLWILSETGIIGFNLALIFIVALWLSLMQVIKIKTLSKEENFEILLFTSVIPGFITAAFFDFPKERIEHLIWFAIILGFCYQTICKHLPGKFQKEIKINYVSICAGIAFCIFAIVGGIYRYLGEYHTRNVYNNKAQNNVAGVIAEGKKALSFIYQIDPTSLPIKWYTGNAYALQNAFELSQHEFTEAYQVNPYNRNVLSDLASSYASVSDNQMAFKYYRESARISPRFDDPKLNMCAIFIREKHYRSADSCLKTLFHDSERRSNYQKLVKAFLPDKNQ